MPLQIKPHSITAQRVTQSPGTNSVLGNPVASSAGISISCLCTPLKPTESFQRFGIVLVDAWVVYLEISDASTLSPQSEVNFGSKVYYVQGNIELHQNGDDADCAVAYITQLQYPGAP
jgi:hypothetical protein